ncbi:MULTISPECIES: sigma factor-like helix-turn-helix DNA-binding protein [Halobacteriales]|uniref:Sigma-70, region 4 n=2 Tax=Halobacteriales TaxID=2235 RepID=A0A1I0R0U1_9EURY|nr:sigma factor-like helix-turn-helix DNA-binding protein [Natrinema salifodinae]SEW33114.1 Sigma-70, region 4 [Natrinema salifodinae]
MNADDAVSELANAGLLTERQAEAFVLRDVEAVPREAAADSMGISKNTLDNTLSTAREKVEKAQQTAEAVEAIRFETVPVECSECGDNLGQTFSRDDSGMALCFDCAGVDPSEVDL